MLHNLQPDIMSYSYLGLLWYVHLDICALYHCRPQFNHSGVNSLAYTFDDVFFPFMHLSHFKAFPNDVRHNFIHKYKLS